MRYIITRRSIRSLFSLKKCCSVSDHLNNFMHQNDCYTMIVDHLEKISLARLSNSLTEKRKIQTQYYNPRLRGERASLQSRIELGFDRWTLYISPEARKIYLNLFNVYLPSLQSAPNAPAFAPIPAHTFQHKHIPYILINRGQACHYYHLPTYRKKQSRNYIYRRTHLATRTTKTAATARNNLPRQSSSTAHLLT